MIKTPKVSFDEQLKQIEEKKKKIIANQKKYNEQISISFANNLKEAFKNNEKFKADFLNLAKEHNLVFEI